MQLLVIQFIIKMFHIHIIKSMFIIDCIYGHHTDFKRTVATKRF